MARRPSRPARPARRSTRSSSSERQAAPAGEREKIIAALMALLAEKPIEQIGLAEIANEAGVSLVQLRGSFSSPLAIVAAHFKDTDRAVLAADVSDMEEESPRERLFDVLMRRLEALAPHRQAIRSLLRSAQPQCAARSRAQRPHGAVAEMDADRSRDRRLGAARRAARARARVAVWLGAAHVGSRRRPGSGPHHGGARPRPRPGSAPLRLPR